MATDEQVTKRIRGLLSSQKVAVLSTYGDGQPYASLVAFRASDDLKEILFVTTRASQKYRNLEACCSAAILVDSRTNSAADFHEAAAVTAIGEVEELVGENLEKHLRRYLSKHPHLSKFASSPTTCMLRLRVKEYYYVSRFQQVERLLMG